MAIGRGHARSFLAGFMLLSAVGTVLALLYISRGRAISDPNTEAAVDALLQHFLPALSIVVGYYFGRKSNKSAKLDCERLIIGAICIAAWYLLPVGIFLTRLKIEPALSLLEHFSPWGDSVVAGVVSFYFAGGSTDNPSATKIAHEEGSS